MTRSGLRLRLRIAVPGRAAAADPPLHLTCGKSKLKITGCRFPSNPGRSPSGVSGDHRHAQVHRPGAGLGARQSIQRREFLPGRFQTDLKPLNFAEPAIGAGLGVAVEGQENALSAA